MVRKPRWAELDEWHSYDSYCAAQANVLEKDPHSLVLDHTVTTSLHYADNGDILAVTEGEIFCRYGVIVDVHVYAETRGGRRKVDRQMTMFSLVYNAYIGGTDESTLLRYDDHDKEDWHVHRRDENGNLNRYPITRAEIPDLGELLDELAEICQARVRNTPPS